MNSDTVIRQLAEADDYAPEHDLPETARPSTVALAEIRRRIDMDAKELTKPVTPARPPQRPWLVLVAAAVAIVLIVGVVAVLSRGGDDVAPATTPSTTLGATPSTTAAVVEESPSIEATTTTAVVPPESDSEAVAVVESMIAGINAGDADSAVAPMLGAGQVVTLAYGLDGDQREVAAGRWTYWVEIESTLELLECTSLTNGTTRCEIARVSPNDYSSPDPELSLVQLRVEEGSVAFMQLEPMPGPWNTQYVAFQDWVDATYPESFMPMFVSFIDPQRSADLVREYYQEWIEAGMP